MKCLMERNCKATSQQLATESSRKDETCIWTGQPVTSAGPPARWITTPCLRAKGSRRGECSRGVVPAGRVLRVHPQHRQLY